MSIIIFLVYFRVSSSLLFIAEGFSIIFFFENLTLKITKM